MLIGIMSDTHDNVPLVKKAIEIFNEKRVGYVIHAGDYTSPFTLKLFKELQCEYVGIFGNNDGDKLLLLERAGGHIRNQPYIFALGDRKIVVMHEHHVVDALLARLVRVLLGGVLEGRPAGRDERGDDDGGNFRAHDYLPA